MRLNILVAGGVGTVGAGLVRELRGRGHHVVSCDLSHQPDEVVLKVTGADPKLVEHRESEILTTKIKKVDISKAVRDLDHKNSYGLEEGMRITADWMRQVYNLR
jgi:dTDP-glucose 4,6-dehydratase